MTDQQNIDKHSILFMGLITSFQQNALIALGKMVNPVSGKSETDLQSAAAFIDMIDMIAVKTEGNLNGEEKSTVDQILSHLKLNYVEELNRPKADEPTEEPGETPDEEKSDDNQDNDEAVS